MLQALDDLNWFRLLLLLLWSCKNSDRPIRTEYSCLVKIQTIQVGQNIRVWQHLQVKGMITSLSLSLHV